MKSKKALTVVLVTVCVVLFALSAIAATTSRYSGVQCVPTAPTSCVTYGTDGVFTNGCTSSIMAVCAVDSRAFTGTTTGGWFYFNFTSGNAAICALSNVNPLTGSYTSGTFGTSTAGRTKVTIPAVTTYYTDGYRNIFCVMSPGSLIAYQVVEN